MFYRLKTFVGSTSIRWAAAGIIVSLAVAVALSLLWVRKNRFVLEIGGPALRVPVSEGDEFVRTYRHSIYEVPVSEKFRIEDGHFRLVHVATQSEAVLWYLGIERKDEPNVDRIFTEFTIPAASIGRHTIWVHHREIRLDAVPNRDGKIRVKLLGVPAFLSFAHLIGR
jgi:hypothetical protein